MPATLIVVDMQPDFKASLTPSSLVGVTKQILLAKDRRWPIIFLEYDEFQYTHSALTSLLTGYHLKARITKKNDGGGREVIRCIKRRKFPISRLRVCGVNADACVKATVNDLLCYLEGSQVEVVKDACASEHKTFTWRSWPKHARLSLV